MIPAPNSCLGAVFILAVATSVDEYFDIQTSFARNNNPLATMTNNEDTTVIQEPMQLDYLMNLRLLPLPGDDVGDFHGDKNHIQNCNSVSELQRTIRFLTESRTDLIASAKQRLEELENQKQPASTSPRVTFESSPSSPTRRTHSPNSASKKDKERFYMFADVLLKYVKQKNHQMYVQAKAIIKDCVSKNRRREQGYESVTVAMRDRLKDLVGDHYWRRANDHFIEYMKRQNRQLKHRHVQKMEIIREKLAA